MLRIVSHNAGVLLFALCVQRRSARSAGGNPAGARARGSVARMAERRETESLKPIDTALFGRAASHRAATKVNAEVASK